MSLQYTRHTTLTLICHWKIPGEKLPDGEPAWSLQNVMICQHFLPGPPREILQGGTILLLGPEDRLKLLSKLWIWVENTKIIIMKKSKSNVNGALQRFMCPFLALRVPYRCTGSTPSHMPCVPLTSPADDLNLQSHKIDGCGPSSVIKIVKMKYNRILSKCNLL